MATKADGWTTNDYKADKTTTNDYKLMQVDWTKKINDDYKLSD